MSDLSSNSTQLWVPSVQVVPASDLPNLWSFKYFNSNAGLPLLACCFFFAISFIHLCMLVISKRFYMLPVVAGLFIQFLGQIFKIITVTSTSTSKALNYYILYSLAIDLVPFLFLASVVLMIRRMIKASDRVCFPLFVRVASHQILILEAGALWFQAYGLLVQVNPLLSEFWGAGNLITLVGCAVEFINILWAWLSVSIILLKQSSISSSTSQKSLSFNFWGFSTVITISLFLIMIRTTSKFIFHLKNHAIEPFRNELLTCLLQGLPIALCAAFLIAFHPCRYDGGNIHDEEHSFFSPEKSDIQSLQSEIAEPRYPSINRTSNSSDPFSAVPLTTTGLPRKQINSRMRSTDQSYVQSPRFPSSLNGSNLHRSNVFDCEKKGEDWKVSHIGDTAQSEVFRIDTFVRAEGSPEMNELSHMKRTSSIYYEKSASSGQESQNHLTTSRTTQHDQYSITSCYSEGSKQIFTTI